MVFRKRGGAQTKAILPKKDTPKKVFEESDDDLGGSSDDSGPAMKTAKGKQGQNNKRVSFQLSGGKNTPAENGTPKSQNNSVKKQQTPGKSALKEFKGVKAMKFEQDSDEEDDDDLDLDDFDMDIDDDLDSDVSDEPTQKLQARASQGHLINNSKAKTPVKSISTPKLMTTPKANATPRNSQTPASEKKGQQKVKSPKKESDDEDDDDEDGDDLDSDDFEMDIEDDLDSDDEEEEEPEQKLQGHLNNSKAKTPVQQSTVKSMSTPKLVTTPKANATPKAIATPKGAATPKNSQTPASAQKVKAPMKESDEDDEDVDNEDDDKEDDDNEDDDDLDSDDFDDLDSDDTEEPVQKLQGHLNNSKAKTPVQQSTVKSTSTPKLTTTPKANVTPKAVATPKGAATPKNSQTPASSKKGQQKVKSPKKESDDDEDEVDDDNEDDDDDDNEEDDDDDNEEDDDDDNEEDDDDDSESDDLHLDNEEASLEKTVKVVSSQGNLASPQKNQKTGPVHESDDEDDTDDDDDDDLDLDDEEASPQKTAKVVNSQENFARQQKKQRAGPIHESNDEDEDDDDLHLDDEEASPQTAVKVVSSQGNYTRQQKNQRTIPVHESDDDDDLHLDDEESSPQKTVKATSSPVNIVKPIKYQRTVPVPEYPIANRLFLGNLPSNIKREEIEKLSSDIVSLDYTAKSKFCFLTFASEAKAQENLKILKNQKLHGKPLICDFSRPDRPLNATNLLKVAGLPRQTTMCEVATMFPKSCSIKIIKKKKVVAYIKFNNQTDATEALNANMNRSVEGKRIIVNYELVKTTPQKRKMNLHEGDSNAGNALKKIKLGIKQDSDDDTE